MRLRRILKFVASLSPKPDESYVDIGCSNGYITNIIQSQFRLGKTSGRDHASENLGVATAKYPQIQFAFIDLNIPRRDGDQYDLVTCFETLEHVGNLSAAIDNIRAFGNQTSRILITVPIEVGFIGLIKFLVKTILFGYRLNELPQKPNWRHYFASLISGERVSKYRDQREGWGTHFGFDYRDVDDVLIKNGVQYKADNFFTTRFYVIR